MGYPDYIEDSALSPDPPRRPGTSSYPPAFRSRLDPSGKYGRFSAWNPALRVECPRARHDGANNSRLCLLTLLPGTELVRQIDGRHSVPALYGLSMEGKTRRI